MALEDVQNGTPGSGPSEPTSEPTPSTPSNPGIDDEFDRFIAEAQSSFDNIEVGTKDPSSAPSSSPSPTPTPDFDPSQPSPTMDPTAENNERRDLGRKVKAQGETIEAQNALIAELKQRLDSIEGTKPVPDSASPITSTSLFDQMNSVIPCPVQYISSPQDAVLVAQWQDEVQKEISRRSRSTFQTSYITRAKSLVEEGGDLHERIMYMISADDGQFNKAMVDERGNPMYSGDIQAEINYHKAHAFLLKNPSSPQPKFKGNSPAGSGVTPPIVPDSSNHATSTVKVSRQMYEVAKQFDLTDEDVFEIASKG